MKLLIVTTLSVASLCSWAHSNEAAFRYVSALMDIVAASQEWNDCIEPEVPGEGVEPDFPTMNSLFACAIPSNVCGCGWSVTERQSAFDQFLECFSRTNKTLISSAYESTGLYAILCSSDKGYTNALGAARRIVRSNTAPCRESALNLLLKLDKPSLLMNETVLSVATNRMMFSVGVRSSATERYVGRLSRCDNHSVVTNAAVGFYVERENVEHLMAVDRLLTMAFPDYLQSSNRLDLSRAALSRPALTNKEKTYFVSQTNVLMRIAESLVTINALE